MTTRSGNVLSACAKPDNGADIEGTTDETAEGMPDNIPDIDGKADGVSTVTSPSVAGGFGEPSLLFAVIHVAEGVLPGTVFFFACGSSSSS